MISYKFSLSNSSFVAANIFFSFVPTIFNVPAATPSGLSVTSLKTSTGLPKEGASSCTPPESVKIK